jgi:HTH-type transcriptional regulator/antitoxin HigA
MKSIKTEEEYNQSIKRLDEIFDAKNNTKEGGELDELILAIKEYEDKHFPIEEPDPIEEINFRKEQESNKNI